MPPTKATRRYAEGTTVPVEKTRTELETLLEKHGAAELVLHRDALRSTLIYRMQGRLVRHVVHVPAETEFAKSNDRYLSGARLSARRKQIELAVQSEHRRRWRALLLIVKAKLEIVHAGESTFEREFLADILLPTKQTVGELLLPQLAETYASGKLPPLLPSG